MNLEKNIKAIEEYYSINHNTALYIYYRFLRSKRSDNKFLPWSIKLQNALVYADKTLGIDWINLKFEDENQVLENNCIDINEQPDYVFKWIENSEWTVVSRKKNLNYKQIVKKIGLFV